MIELDTGIVYPILLGIITLCVIVSGIIRTTPEDYSDALEIVIFLLGVEVTCAIFLVIILIIA